jgi:hypothetical protein
MKLRHAAALALLGWYLVVPPPLDSSGPDLHAPLSHWNQAQAFDTAAQCETQLVQLRKTISAERPRAQLDEADQAMKSAKCIATDDPRLAK